MGYRVPAFRAVMRRRRGLVSFWHKSLASHQSTRRLKSLQQMYKVSLRTLTAQGADLESAQADFVQLLPRFQPPVR